MRPGRRGRRGNESCKAWGLSVERRVVIVGFRKRTASAQMWVLQSSIQLAKNIVQAQERKR